MSRLMFLTVGTSLFHSASWEPDRVPPAVPSYRDLCHDVRLRSPEARLGFRSAKEELEAALDASNAQEWADRLPEELVRDGRHATDTLLRYSAELSTVLRLADQDGEGGSARDFLDRYRRRIFVLADPAPPPNGEVRRASSWVAAHHLRAYLDAVAGGRAAELVPIEGLASLDREVLFGRHTGLGELARAVLDRVAEHRAVEVDLVVTGGYKLYAFFLARLLEAEALAGTRTRLVYGHESGGMLVSVSREHLVFDGLPRTFDFFFEPPGLGGGRR